MTNTQHKHHDLIIAWAKGAKIQWRATKAAKWIDTDEPGWYVNREYRIKPEPKPDIWYEVQITLHNPVTKTPHHHLFNALFDGETGKFKSIELI
jgi:hypothetical protein